MDSMGFSCIIHCIDVKVNSSRRENNATLKTKRVAKIVISKCILLNEVDLVTNGIHERNWSLTTYQQGSDN